VGKSQIKSWLQMVNLCVLNL